MSRVFFAGELDTVATWWRVYRRDGVTLGFTTHDRDLAFAGILHRAAPGMLPSAVRLSTALEDDEAAVEGALSHAAIREDELAAGRFDGARVEMGLVDWRDGAAHLLYSGTIAAVSRDGGRFSADLQSLKTALGRDPVPRTGPACRAEFCGPGCDLNAQAFETRARVVAVDPVANSLSLELARTQDFVFGTLRFLEGIHAGEHISILSASENSLTLDRPLDARIAPGERVLLRQGCDHTIATCAARFGNAANFRGEPYLPGTDLLTQYPVPR